MTLGIHELLIRSFRCYREARVAFDRGPGVYYVCGINNTAPGLEANGAGKTSIFDALSWCWYGKTLDDERPGTAIEPWTGERNTLVRTCHSRDSAMYRISRTRHPNRLFYEQKVGADWGEAQECDQAKIDELVGLSYDVFRCTIVLPQFGALFLDLTAEQQTKLFTDTLSLSVWEDAAELASSMARELAKENDALRARYNVLFGKLGEQNAVYVRERELAKSFATRQGEGLEVLGRQLATLDAQIATARKPPEKPLGVPTGAELAAIRATIGALKGAHGQALAERADAEGMLAQIGAVVAADSALLGKYNAAPKKCPECGQPTKSAHVAARKKALSDGIALLHVEETTLLDLMNSAGKEADRLRAQFEPKELAYLDGVALSQEHAQKDARRAGELAGLVGKRKVLADRIAAMKAMVNQHAATVRTVLAEKETTTQEYAQLESVLAETQWSEEVYRYWADSYKHIRLGVVDKVLRALSFAANKNAEELGLFGWRIEFGTERETVAGKVAREFTTLLYPPMKQEPVRFSSYCGGERQRWQLATRFALSELLLDHAGIASNVEILDEPTQHMTALGVENLIAALQTRAKRLGRQIWLVDHNVLDMRLFGGVVTVQHDEDGAHINVS